MNEDKISVVYDIECLPNITTLAFIQVKTSQEKIDRFKELDIRGEDCTYYFLNEINGRVFVFDKSLDIEKELYALREYVNNIEIIVGYNNHNYDDVLLFHILTNIKKYIAMIRNNMIDDILLDMYNSSGNIIDTEKFIINDERKNYRKYPNKPISIDLQKLNHLDVSFTSLKQCQIILCWHNVKEFELPPISEIDADYYKVYISNGSGYTTESLIDHKDRWEEYSKMNVFQRYIPPEYKDELIYYNINDTMSTLALFRYSYGELMQRLAATELYKVNVRSLSRSSTAEKLISTFYIRESNEDYRTIKDRIDLEPVVALKNIVDKSVQFNTPRLKELLTKINNTIVFTTGSTFKDEFIYADNKFSVGLGGLHTIDRPGILTSTYKYTYTDADAESYYPTTIINNNLSPKHMDINYFMPMYKTIRDRRVYAKHNRYNEDGTINQQLSDENEILKIVLNAVYGKSREPNSILFDPYITYGVTINCQLYMLKLVEMLTEANIKVVSANTDGVVSKVYNTQQDVYNKVCEEWQALFNQTLEFTKYVKYIRADINNYISIKPGGKVKAKGRFLNEVDLAKGYIHPVVTKGVYEYFINGVKPDDFLHNHDNIYDFCIAIKVGKQFTVEYQSLNESELDRKHLTLTNRFYISNSGGAIVKIRKDNGQVNNLAAGEYVRLFNKFYRVPMKEYDIKYNFYKGKIMEVINNVIGNTVEITRKGTTKISGKMFDELED